MDDVRIYNRSLSTGEMQQLYTLTDKAQTVDCNPTNIAINPLGTEICDGVDNDCDGSIDEGVGISFYEDLDGDGY